MLRIARQTSYRSWRLGAAGFVLVFGAVCLYTALQGPKYRSEAKLYVRLGRESASLDPTALPGPSVASAESRALEINSVLEVLSSEELARQVVAQLGSDAVLGAAPSGRADAGGKLAFLNGVNLNPLRSVSREEQARRTVGERLHVGTAKNSNVVSLYYDARDPKSARDVLQALIGAAVELHLRVKQSQGCANFFNAQLIASQRRLQAAEDQLRNYRQETGLVDFELQRKIAVERAAEVERELRDNEVAYATGKRELDACRELVAAMPHMSVVEESSGHTHTAVDGMREQFYALQMTQEGLRAKLTDEHPLMKEAAQQAARARQVVDREPDKKLVRYGANSAYELIVARLAQGQIAVATFELKAQKLREQLKTAQADIAGLLNRQAKCAALERAVALAEDDYRTHAHNDQQVRLDSALQLQNVSNVGVLQQPTLAETPVSPNPSFNLTAGALLGLFAGVLLAVNPRWIRRRAPGGEPGTPGRGSPPVADISGKRIAFGRVPEEQEPELAATNGSSTN